MFIVNLEVPVVITALVAITNELGGFGRIGWVVASYLLGYVGSCQALTRPPSFILINAYTSPLAVIVVFAKASDIFGRKLIFLFSIAIFIIFSAACSASQTINQLSVNIQSLFLLWE